jgi:hypothetical protein
VTGHERDHARDRALVRAILRNAAAFEWKLQDIGLLGLRLDDRREFRLHVWAPDRCVGELPVHDHPFDFTSTIVAGEMTNTRYVEDPAGETFVRTRYTPGTEDDEDARVVDSVRLRAQPETFSPGECYGQLAHELHDSRQVPGTVSIMRMTFRAVRPLSVCTREERPWVSGLSRPATPDEVATITAAALAHFD